MRTKKVELTQKEFPLLACWARAITNTEFVAERLREELDLTPPSEYSYVYRVQPKLTGCERRSALCYQTRSGCDDINSFWGESHRRYFGIDLFNSVEELAKAESITIEQNDDLYLWVYVTKEERG